jgi:hypothetical protein
MCRSNDREKKEHDRTGKKLTAEFKDSFAIPPARLDQLFDDPAMRRRVGEWSSLAMNGAIRRPRPRR